MFKKIPGNPQFRINLDGKIIDFNGREVHPEKSIDGCVKIEMFGEGKLVTLDWLKHLAWYEASVIPNLHEHLDNIFFVKHDKALKTVCGFIMCFKKPIYYFEDLRIIPCFPSYAISYDGGTIVNIETNETIYSRGKYDGYISVYLRNPDKCKNRTTKLHRLVGFAWLPGNDFELKPFINHKDGIRDNNKVSNLEWTNDLENAQHAHVTGLINLREPIKIRDVHTGEIKTYISATEFAEEFGDVSRIAMLLNRLPGFVYKKRYEIKKLDDNTPWYYENPDVHYGGKPIYTFEINDPDTNKTVFYHNLKMFVNAYGLKIKPVSAETASLEFKKQYPALKLKYTKNALSGPYRVLNIVTNKITTVQSMVDVSEITGQAKSTIRNDLSDGKKFIYLNKWIVATGNNKIMVKDYVERPPKYTEVSILGHDGVVLKNVDSLRKAATYTGLDRKTIERIFRNGQSCKGYCLRALTP